MTLLRFPCPQLSSALRAAGLALLLAASGCAHHPAATSPEPAQAPQPGTEAAAAPAPATSSPGDVASVKDQRALDELRRMSDALARARSMSFDTVSMTPIRGPNHQWVHVLKTAHVQMQRPGKLSIVSGGDAVAQHLVFDGKTLSISASDRSLYSQTPMQGNVDAMLAQASQKGAMAFTFSDVLLSNPMSSWSNSLEGAVYIGESVRNGEKLEHLALSENDEDWEVFTGKQDHLPRLVYVKYLGTERSPSVLIEFSHWKLNPAIPASAFAFKPPAGARKASLKAPKEAS